MGRTEEAAKERAGAAERTSKEENRGRDSAPPDAHQGGGFFALRERRTHAA